MPAHLTCMRLTSFPAMSLATVSSLIVSFTACNRSKMPPPPPTMSSAPPINPATAPVPAPPPPSFNAPESIAWDLPKGWSEARGNGMRFATLKPPVPGKLDVSVVTLPGQAGGELDNVNRWRSQIGLAPVDDPTRAHMRQDVRSKAGTIALYDFATAGANQQRMIAAILFTGERSWFFKMVGDEAAVAAARPGFHKLIESLRLPAEADR
jgi:hypothetical protein